MKKILFVMPLMAVSLLTSCSNSNPEPKDSQFSVYFKCTDCALYENETKITASPIMLDEGTNKTFLVKPNDENNDVDVDYIGNCVVFDKGTNTITITNINENVSIIAKKKQHTPLEYYSWNAINEIAINGVAEEYFNIGEEKTVMLNNQPHKVRIIDFNKDVIHNEGDGPIKKAGITFEFANVISDSDGCGININWDMDGDQIGDNCHFTMADINQFLNPVNGETSDCVYNLLPKELREVIKLVDKKVATSDDGGEVYEVKEPFSTLLFPLAYSEFTKDELDPVDYVFHNEGDLYKFYENPDSGIRIKQSTNGADRSYWLRSPLDFTYAIDPTFTFVWDFYIGIEYLMINGSHCVAPAFCI